MMDFDYDIEGKVDLVRVCTWPEADGLTAWRSDIAGRVGHNFSFTMWFEDEPVSLSTVVIGPERGTSGIVRMKIWDMDVSGFERFVPQWRWLLTRLGLVPFGTSPLRGIGGSIAENLDPWIGRFISPVASLTERALSLDQRLANVWQTASEWDQLFGRVLPRLDPNLADDVNEFLSSPSSDAERVLEGGGGFLGDGAYLHYRSTHDDVFHRTGDMQIRLMRRVAPGSAVTLVDEWEGKSLVDLLRWLENVDAHLHWQVFEQKEWEEWFRQNSPPGQLALPEEEVQLFALMGEALPYAWNNERLSAWAENRRKS